MMPVMQGWKGPGGSDARRLIHGQFPIGEADKDGRDVAGFRSGRRRGGGGEVAPVAMSCVRAGEGRKSNIRAGARSGDVINEE